VPAAPDDYDWRDQFDDPETMQPNTQAAAPRMDVHQLIAGHQIPGIKLPNENKVAFTEDALFQQQFNMQTRCNGLQLVLDALHATVKTFAGCEEIPLREYQFVVNFAHAADPERKRFAFRMKQPITGDLELIQYLEQGSLSPNWWALHNGQQFAVQEVTAQIEVQETVDRPIREHRSIQLDD